MRRGEPPAMFHRRVRAWCPRRSCAFQARPASLHLHSAFRNPHFAIAYALLIAAAALLPCRAWAQEVPGAGPLAVSTPALAIPLADVATRVEEVNAYLRSLEERLAPSAEILSVEAQLPERSERIRAHLERTNSAQAGTPPLTEVDNLTQVWRGLRDEFSAWNTALAAQATERQREIDELDRLRAVWQASRDEAQASNAPAAIIDRIRATLSAIRAMRKRVEARQAQILVLQDRVAQQAAACEQALAQLDRFRASLVGRLFVPDRAPIWSRERRPDRWAELPARVRESAAGQVALLQDYFRRQSSRVPLHALLFLALLLVIRQARARTRRWIAEDGSLARVATVFERPLSSALVLALLATLWIYPQAPPVLRQVVGLLALLPVLRILQRLVDAPVLSVLYALAAFFLADRVRNLCAVVPQLEEVLLLVELLAGVLFLAWLVRSGRLARLAEAPTHARLFALLDRLARVVLGVFAFALLVGALGYMQLARLAEAAVLGSGYIAILIFAALRIAQGLLAYGLRTRTLCTLHMVQHHRALLQRRGEVALRWLAGAGWALAALEGVHLLDPILDVVRVVLTASFAVGAFRISLADVVAFGLTVWFAFLASAFVRFVLAEDVFPRVRLAAGLPYAVSTVLHYGILLLGFLIALAAMGLDLNRFTILAGAFGVGIGFGLQNVVNNFVSGLILLFERPIKVGDTVQIGELMGEIRRIGIRSSTVRTREGAEVLVPNANLISDPVTNWTLSDRMQRIDVPVGVAYGIEPERVLDLLRNAALSHPLVLRDPPPSALFLGFGDNALNFQLRAWTDPERFEQAVQIRSDLAVAVHAALRDAGIPIPFPQRDLHLSTPEPIDVRLLNKPKGE